MPVPEAQGNCVTKHEAAALQGRDVIAVFDVDE